MNFRELAEILCKTTDLNVDKIMAVGGCSIRFQDSFDVNIEWEEETNSVCLYTLLCPIPETGQTELYTLLLQTHLFGAATQGSMFGIYQQKKIILFKKIRISHLTEIECLEALQQFVQQSAFWIIQLPVQIAAAAAT